jgi:hypothetical protein
MESESKTTPEDPQVSKNRGFARLYFTVTKPKTKRAAQMARGPRRSRMGSMKIALMRPRTPLTAIPRRRKGSVSNHTMGYSTRASSAIGQHKMSRIIHKKKAAIATSFVTIAEQFMKMGQHCAAFYSILRDRARKGFLHCILIEPQALSNGRRYLGIEPHVGILDFRVEDAPERMNHSQRAAFRQRQSNRK